MTVHKSQHTTDASRGKSEPKQKPVRTYEDLKKLDPDTPVCVMSNSWIKNCAIKYYLLYFRFVGVKLTDLLVTFEEFQITLHLDIFTAKVDLDPNQTKNLKAKARIIQQKINGIEVFDSCVLDARAALDFDTGNLSGLSLHFDTTKVKFRLYSILKKYINNGVLDTLKNKKENRLMTESEILDMIHERLRMFCNIVRLVELLNISFQGINITEIPLVPKEVLRCPYYTPVAFIHLKINSFVLSWERLFLESPGYGLMYDYTDKPYTLVYNSTGISMSMEHVGKSEPREIVTIPVLNMNGTSNIAFQTLVAITSDELTASKVILTGHISEPIIDLSTDDVSTAVMSAIDFLTFFNRQDARSEKEGGARRPSQQKFEKISMAQKWEVAKNLSKVWPVVELKLSIENPVIMSKSFFDERYSRILLVKINTVSIELTTNREERGNTVSYSALHKFIIHNAKLEYRNTQTGLKKKAINLEDISIKQEMEILPTPRLTTSVYTETATFDFTSIKMLYGINLMFSELDETIVPQIREYRRFLNSLDPVFEDDVCADQSPKEHGDNQSVLEIIQELIPCWLQKIEVNSFNNTVKVGSRSLLLNKEIVKSIDPQTKNDLVGGELRTVEMKIDQTCLTLQKCDAVSMDVYASASALVDDDKGLVDTASETSSESDGWKLSYIVTNIVGKIRSETSSNKNVLHDKVYLKIPTATINVKPYEAEDKLVVSLDVGKVEGLYSVITHFIVDSSLHLIRNTLFEFLLKNPVGEKRKSSKSSLPKKIMSSVEATVRIGFVDSVCVMPDRMRMRLELLDVRAKGMLDKSILVAASQIRLCTDSPTVPGFWTRLITASDGATRVNIPTIVNGLDGPWFELSNDICHITAPHHLVTYKIFDNISVMVKTLKQLHHSLKYNSDEFVIRPHAKGPTKIPKMNLKSNRLVFSMDDDPFEAELNMIFQIGLLEQKMRYEKLCVFEKMVADELQNSKKAPSKPVTDDQVSGLAKISKWKGNKRHRYSGSLNGTSSTSPPTKDGAPSSIPDHASYMEEKRKKLLKIQESFSKSWISRVKGYKAKMEQNFQESFEYLWGSVTNNKLPYGFNYKVLDYVTNPSLMSLILEGADMDLSPPSCGYGDGLKDFLHDVGKGIPKDNEYSTLIPLHADLRLSELRCHLRDYPLPFIHMPAISKSQAQNVPAIRISGNLIIGENMIHSQTEVREVYVPLVPGCAEFDEDDCYSIEVPKTLTAIKFYTSLDWELNSELATSVVWGTSYQPAIQQLMLNLDHFTKPPIDPSEKVGFWDKIRANLHARIFMSWVDSGELQIFFKGSKDPYAIGGESSGFMLGFKDQVNLNLNSKENPKEFIAVKSQEVTFAVPNHFAQPVPIWSKSMKDSLWLWEASTNFQKSAFGYYMADHTPIDLATAQTFAKSFIEKCVIRLTGGVQFNLALFFERRVSHGSVERTSEFSPHYNVVLRNPKYVSDREHYDAYEGFRSEFIHLGFTLISQNDTAYNTIQLTPCTFQYFFSWWKMFSNTLPVRHGRLFGPAKSSKKFSRHLYTISYRAEVTPLFISHIYRDFELAVTNPNKIHCVGVKGRAGKFSMDLHQRKEMTFEHNSNLGVTRRAMSLKFNRGKLDFQDLDVRILEGVFDRLNPDTKTTSGHDSNNHTFESFDGDLCWHDLNDFTEIYEASVKRDYSGQINAYPLMYTPRFLYFKRQSYGDKYQLDAATGERVKPFNSEEFHNCSIDANPSFEIQKTLFEKRLIELEAKLDDNMRKIENIKALMEKSAASPHDVKLANQLKVDNQQLCHGMNFVRDLYSVYMDPTPENRMRMSSYNFAVEEGPDEESFNNIFLIHNMMLKWNGKSRDGFYRYVYLFELRGSTSSFRQHKSLSQLDEAIETQKKAQYNGETDNAVSRVITYESRQSDKKDGYVDPLDDTNASYHLNHFKEELRQLAANCFYKTRDNYLVKLISPQIQLQGSDDLSVTVLVTAPKIELDIIAFDAADSDDDYEERIFQQRFGAILSDASIFMFHENEIMTTGKLFFNPSSYGSLTAWPPWLGVELCYDGSLISDHVIMKKTSVMVRYDKVINGLFGLNDLDVNRLSCDLSRVTMTCDAKQYMSLYTIVMQLMVYNDPKFLKLKHRQSKMSLSLDLNDLPGIKGRIVTLQDAVRHADDIIENICSRRAIIDDIVYDDLCLVRSAKHEASMELFFLMKISALGNRKSTEEADDYLEWNLRADDIKLHMLDDHRCPFLDVILTNAHFKRMERSDRSDRNHITIQNLEVINLDKSSTLPVVFSAHHVQKKPQKITREADEEPLIHINWHMDYPVGGIRVMRKFEVDFQPIQISIEEVIGKKILKYAFPHEPSTDYDTDVDDAFSQSSARSSLRTPSILSSVTSGTSSNGHGKKRSNGGIFRSTKTQVNGAGHTSTQYARDSRSSTSLSVRSRDGNIDSLVLPGDDEEEEEEEEDGLDEMVARASKYLSFVSFRLKSTTLCITFRGKGSKKLINVTNFILHMPEIYFTNKTYTLIDLTMHIKKILVKALLSHTGSIIGNKLSKRNTDKSLKNVSNYAANRINTFREK